MNWSYVCAWVCKYTGGQSVSRLDFSTRWPCSAHPQCQVFKTFGCVSKPVFSQYRTVHIHAAKKDAVIQSHSTEWEVIGCAVYANLCLGYHFGDIQLNTASYV